MIRKAGILLTAGLALQLSCRQENVATYDPIMPSPETLELTIARSNGGDYYSHDFKLHRPEDHFHVLLRNSSTNAVAVCGEYSDCTHCTLSFALTDKNGSATVVRMFCEGLSMGGRPPMTLAPGETIVYNVTFASNLWINSPLAKPPTRKGDFGIWEGSITALFDMNTPHPAFDGLWAGHISSKPLECRIMYE